MRRIRLPITPAYRGLPCFVRGLQRCYSLKPCRCQLTKVDGWTPAQRFFLNYATIWRNTIRDEALRVRLNTDPHSPGKFRVIGPLSDLPEFHEAFGCKAGDPLVLPEAERPSIW